MKVISLINGIMISEASSIYALHYAKSFGLELSLIHIKESSSLSSVIQLSEDIKALAKPLGIEVELIILESRKELKTLISTDNIDIVFCSTKHHHALYESSFPQSIIKMNMEVDFAIVKVVKLSGCDNVEKIILPIRGTQLSVKKFTFFTTFINSYNSNAEIFSVDTVTKKSTLKIDTKQIKERLQKITFSLRHYFRLAKIMDLKFSIRHSFALIEGEEVQNHIVKNSYDLVIVGAHHKKSFFSSHHPIDVLFERPTINTIYFIPYNDEL